MQYLTYFIVATPLVLCWLFWASATTPPQPPMFNSGLNAIYADAPRAAPATTKKAVTSPGSEIADKATDKKG